MPANPLTLREREEIRAGIERSESITAIAETLGRHRTTVSVEISRNGGRDNYRAVTAQNRADQQRLRPRTTCWQADPVLAGHVTERLRARDSPMTIALELDRGLYPQVTGRVSHETIYRGVYGHGRCGLPKGLHPMLHRRRRCRKHRLRAGETPVKPSPLGVFSPITARPSEADGRGVVGHLEGDLILGAFNRSALVTVFDRATRYVWLADLPEGHGADATLAGLIELIERIPAPLRRSLTWDRGTEMARHADLTEAVGIDVYFCDPHSPWQRPTNENGNGLIRRYVGKSTNLNTYTPTDLRAIEHRINTTPRRTLNWSTAKTHYDATVAMTD